jgi:hypothetical protein
MAMRHVSPDPLRRPPACPACGARLTQTGGSAPCDADGQALAAAGIGAPTVPLEPDGKIDGVAALVGLGLSSLKEARRFVKPSSP